MSAKELDLAHVSVLLIDDNPYHRAIVIEVLRAAGVWQVTTASNGMEGLDELRLLRPSVVLLDWTMQPIDGPAFLQLARRNEDLMLRATPIIMLTAKNRRQDVEQARAAGVNEYLVKPVSAGSLLSKIQEVLLRPRRFVDSAGYVGPCRRRKNDREYMGPKRRLTDGIGDAVEDNPNRKSLLAASVARVQDLAGRFVQDQSQHYLLLSAAEETAALAEQLHDEALRRGAESLSRYLRHCKVNAAEGAIVEAHVQALQQMLQARNRPDERAKVAEALELLVTHRARRTVAA